MLEAEMAFFDLDDNLRLQEEMIKYVVDRILQRCSKDFKLLDRDISRLESITLPFPRISYTEAVELLRSKGVEFVWGDDFGAPEETLISESFNAPVFVHRYPTAIKAFYMKPDPDQPEVVLGADLLAPEGYGEIIGGGQRIDVSELLKQRIEEHGLPQESLEWYLDLRRYGSVPHSGFGLGIERTVAWLCGLDHVRESIPFPRLLYRMYP
jgi:asparaginyl-tRNA synthetase